MKSDVSVLDILDKLLEKGVVVKGDVVLSVADVDLVYLNLELLLSSVARLGKGMEAQKDEKVLDFAVNRLSEDVSKDMRDEKNVEKGLARLVLAIINLLRKLMERQAVRRMEMGQLTDAETEKIGNTFLLLDKRMNKLRETFRLKDDDLNLDLGPLGRLT